jgi:hypothetical protein
MKAGYYIFFMLLYSTLSQAQQPSVDSLPNRTKNFAAEVGAQLTATSNGQVPFWMRANQFGSIPQNGLSGSLVASVSRDYDHREKKRLVDWGIGFDGRLNIGNKVEFIPVEAFLKGRLGVFQLKVGRSKDMSGLVDSTLSTGSFAISGNALGIPKIELSIPEFTSLSFTRDLIAVKGAFSYGWMGRTPIQSGENSGARVKTFFHNKSFHARFGRPDWRLKFYAGINHEVMWGSDRFIFGDEYSLSDLKAFYYVVTGKKYNPDSSFNGRREISKIGNHQGAVDLGVEYQMKNVKVFVYRQQFYDKGALYYLANIMDGLNGFSLTNTTTSKPTVYWHKFLFEVFYSKNQAGEENAKKTPSGPEHYYNHGVYQNGYSYRGLGLGNPFITAASLAQKNLPNAPDNFFINNRVLAYHFGMEGGVENWKFVTRLSYSKNYGDYKTSDVKYYWSNGKLRERTPVYGIFPEVGQFSGYLDASRPLKNGLNLGFAVAYDHGELLYNSIGGFIKLTKKW